MNTQTPSPSPQKIVEYLCSDGYLNLTLLSTSPAAAARRYVDEGDFTAAESTIWIAVSVQAGEETEIIDVELHPAEPKCVKGQPHDWKAPYSVVGGLPESPGVFGNGPGITYTEVCRHCAAYRRGDTFATNPETGERGFRSITYDEPDEASELWLLALPADEA